MGAAWCMATVLRARPPAGPRASGTMPRSLFAPGVLCFFFKMPRFVFTAIIARSISISRLPHYGKGRRTRSGRSRYPSVPTNQGAVGQPYAVFPQCRVLRLPRFRRASLCKRFTQTGLVAAVPSIARRATACSQASNTPPARGPCCSVFILMRLHIAPFHRWRAGHGIASSQPGSDPQRPQRFSFAPFTECNVLKFVATAHHAVFSKRTIL